MMRADRNAVPKRAPRQACPVCGGERSTEFAPFCSRRCADVDLHRWLAGTHVIPGVDGDALDPPRKGESPDAA